MRDNGPPTSILRIRVATDIGTQENSPGGSERTSPIAVASWKGDQLVLLATDQRHHDRSFAPFRLHTALTLLATTVSFLPS